MLETSKISPGAPLRFVHFTAWRVVVPARRDILSAAATPLASGLPWDELPITLVEGKTSDGLIAYGETERGASREAVEETLRHLLTVDLCRCHPRSSWQGVPPSEVLRGSYPSDAGRAESPFLQCLYETLWLDAVGKASGLPAHALLGGKIRDRVAVDAWANRPPAKVLAALVAEAAVNGYQGMKLKCDASGDIARKIHEIRQDVPTNFSFTIDPMCSWRSYGESRTLFQLLEPLPFLIRLEDPFPHRAVGEWQRARAISSLPLIWHARSQQILLEGISAQAADGFNLIGDPVFEFITSATMIEAMQMLCWQGTALELGIMQHAKLHASAVARSCQLPSDFQSEWVRTSTLVDPPMKIENGEAFVPDEPGLGTALDISAVERHSRERFSVC